MDTHEQTDHPAVGRFRPAIAIFVAALIAAAFGVLTLLGWVLGLPLLASFGTDLISMAPSTALLFLLYGVAVCLRARTPLSGRGFWISVALICLGTLIALLLFTLGCLDIHWAVEHLGLTAPETIHGAPIGHMSPLTAFCFLLASVSFLASLSLSAARSWRAVPALGAAGVLLGTCLVLLLAYCFGAPLLHGGSFIPPALNTILAFALLGLALLTLAGRSVGLFDGTAADGRSTALPFTLIFTLLAAGFVTVGYLYYRNYERNYRSEAEHELSAITELKVSELTRWRKERMADAGIFLKNPSFSALVRRFFAQPADADAQRQILDWLGKFPPFHGYDQFRLMDAQGVTRLSVPGGLNPASSDSLRMAAEVLRSGQIGFHDFYRHERDHRIYLQVLVPLFDGLDANRPLGVLALRIDPATYLYPFIKRWPVPSETAETLLIRREGNEAVFLNELRFQTNTALTLRAPLDRTKQPAVMAALGTEGIVEGRDYRGVPVIAAVRAIPDSPWFLVARMDTAEVFAPLRERLWLTVFLVGVLLLGAGASVGLVRRHQRMQFYKERAQAAEAVRRAHERLRRFVDANIVGVVIAGADGRILEANDYYLRLIGFTREELEQGKVDWRALTPPEWLPADEQAIRELRARGTCTPYEKEYVRRDGTRVPVFLADALLPGPEEQIAAFALDLTERKRAEEALQKAHHELEQRVAERTGELRRANEELRTEITERKQAEEALRESEERFRIAAETANDVVYEWDLQQSVQWFGKIDEMLAYGPGEFPRTLDSWAASVHPEDLERTMAEVQAHLEGRAPYAAQYRVRRRDGIYRWWSARGAAARTPDGKPIRMIGSITDITERKQTEEALRESEQRFRILFEQAIDGMLLADAQTKRFTLANHQIQRLLGYSEAELLQLTVADLHQAADLPAVLEQFEQHARGEIPLITNIPMRRKDGTVFYADISASAVRLQQRDCLFGIFRDITERKRAEETLRESERRLRELTESLPQLVWTCRADGPWDYLSPQWVAYTGIPEKEQLGFGWLEQLHPEDRAPTIVRWNAAVGAGLYFDIEFRIRRSDGVYRWFKTRALPLRDREGRMVKWFGTSSDIEDQKRAEEQVRRSLADLERSNKELEQFAYVASHDLQEPLRMVSSYTQLLAQRYEGQIDDKAKKYIRYAVDGAIRMQSLINDLLAYSRVGTQGQPLEPTDSHSVLGEALRNLAATTEENRAIITNDDLPTVRADASQLVQVFQNLLANAIKFRGKDLPRVHVSAQDQGGEWIFSVKDNGIGIEPQHAERVFVIFQRLHTREEYPGTGIGLAVCKRIVERHGGKIWFESEPGNGATFFFTVPK